ncbi:MAG: hypothetical protein J0L52_09245 [Caulobacterales bacterium]|nr:hypothetical protein [Caulobacterales bacterium]
MVQATAREARFPVRLAAFGTLSNGSDVRLLASPRDEPLSSEARAAIEQFFYKAWRGSRRRTAPYFAFLPLDHDAAGQAAHWGLMRVTHLGIASMGAVIVLWVAVIATDDLDRIGWQTHRLWSTALPEARLPEVGEQTSPRTLGLGPSWNTSLDPYLEGFERAAYALSEDAAAPRARLADLVLEAPASDDQQPLTPEGALFGVWSQLGHWCADLSYCTWGDIDSAEPSKNEGPTIDVRVGRSDPVGPGRVEIRLGRTPEAETLPEPSPSWLIVRQMQTGIRPVTEVLDELDEQADEVATTLFRSFEAAFQQSIFSPLDQLRDFATDGDQPTPGQQRVFQGFLPKVLDVALGRLTGPARLGILDYYLQSVLPRMDAAMAGVNPAHAVARLAINHGVIHQLSDNQLATLAPALFDMPPGEHDLLDPLIDAIRAAPPTDVNWSGLLFLALSDSERATSQDRLDEVLVEWTAGAWSFPAHREVAEEGLAQFIDRNGPVSALAIIGAAPRHARRSLFAAIAARRARTRLSSRRRDPANPRALVIAMKLLGAGANIERDQRRFAR